jgi:predicted small lipoprotein YifL
MRGLFRAAVALFTLGFAVTGCGRSGSSGSSESGKAPEDMPHHAAFRVPGMS